MRNRLNSDKCQGLGGGGGRDRGTGGGRGGGGGQGCQGGHAPPHTFRRIKFSESSAQLIILQRRVVRRRRPQL